MTIDDVFKAYDVRGLVPEQLNPELAYCVGRGFARLVQSPKVIVGRDMRPSGVELSAAFAAGANAEGVAVVDIGLVSTDLTYFASGTLGLPAAMFTASHNPAQYNGIELCRAGAAPIGVESGLQDIREWAKELAGEPISINPVEVEHNDLLEAFADHVCSFVRDYQLRPLKVVADTANGMGGLIAPVIFGRLPFEIEVIYQDLDGTFPNHPPDPIQTENLRDLQERLLTVGADVGLAFDGDADRVFLVDNDGIPVPGSTTTSIVAAALLDRTDEVSPAVIHNLICSRAVPEIISEHGGVPVRTRVGHSFIKAEMARTNALFGGEHSGHYYFRDNYRADSGIIAAVIVLAVLSESGLSLSELRKGFERYVPSGEINTEVADPQAVIETIAQHYGDMNQDRLDGLTVDGGEWWFNLRPSNTEPLLRLNLEAPSVAAMETRRDELLSQIAAAASV